LRPDLEITDLVARLSAREQSSRSSNWLRKAAHLSPVGIGLLQEAAIAAGVSLSSLSPASLAGLINAVPILLNGHRADRAGDLDRGRIAFDELDPDFMIRRLPGVFASGEMLTGARSAAICCRRRSATGAAAGRGALKWLWEAAK